MSITIVYSVFYDNDSRPSSKIEVNVYCYENAVKTAESVHATGDYFPFKTMNAARFTLNTVMNGLESNRKHIYHVSLMR